MVSLRKLIVSHDLLLSMITNQIAFDQQDSKSISNFEPLMDRFPFSGFQIGNLGYHQFKLTVMVLYIPNSSSQNNVIFNRHDEGIQILSQIVSRQSIHHNSKERR